tara:strand:+ start:5594 stop:6910 length:1317 start_codon:yes stop_codon:yes gene_type:complete
MATNKKITDLSELSEASLANDDVLPIVDVSAGTTHKVRKDTLASALSGVSSISATTPIAVNQSTGAVTVSTGTIPVSSGGTGTTTLTDGGVLLGSGTGAVTAMSALSKGQIIVGDGSTDPQALSVGSNGTVLKANSSETLGVEWASESTGAVTSYTNAADNRVITSVDSSTINGEANLTFDGSVLAVSGNVTATGTVEPAGDTAAGDDAAIGYTAAEGLILTGQGSTNDVTIKNDADADVIEIPTGTQNVTMQGTLDVVGDLTAGTFTPDGDTAAGDSAAIGYTAAEGLILTGQGSTNDVTIKNDADADVIEIPTGTTNVTVAGQFNGGTIILAETDTDTSNTGSVTIDFSAHQNFVLTLTGNVTLANPSTESVGQAGVFVFIQDGTGSRTLSLGTDYETAGGAGITLSTAASAVDVVPYFVKAANSIQLGAIQKAFS